MDDKDRNRYRRELAKALRRFSGAAVSDSFGDGFAQTPKTGKAPAPREPERPRATP
jgi:hypothetical protein